MTGDCTREHYDRLAANYDENWAHSPAFLDWMSGCILRRLQLTGTEAVADIGGGTGLYARALAPHAASVVCADASAAMLAQVPATRGLVTAIATAEDVAAGRTRLSPDGFDAILLKEVLHHVADPAAVIGGLAGLLRPGGRMLVVMLPARVTYPLFAGALELFAARQPDPAVIADHMRAAGLGTSLSYETFPLSFPTGRYLQMVRNRYMSLLSSFTDAQLEAGVREIRRSHPEETISFPDTLAFIRGQAA